MSPFCHLELAAKSFGGLPRQITERQGAWQALMAGALAPDAGYYHAPGLGMAETAHQLKPWQVARALLEAAQTPVEYAFAVGWLSHAILDREGHGRLVNRLSGGPYSQKPLQHKQTEWGLAAWQLSRPEAGWLWDYRLPPGLGAGQVAEAFDRVHGRRLSRQEVEEANRAQGLALLKIAKAFLATGRSRKASAPLSGSLGKAAGLGLRPAMALIFRARGDLDRLAISNPALPDEWARGAWERLLAIARERLMAVVEGGDWPSGDLDADPAGGNELGPAAQRARAWLREGAR